MCVNDDVIKEMFENTGKLLADRKTQMLNETAISYVQSSDVVSNVEFWNWMNRNYSGANGHMFSSNQAMRNYISQSQGKADWMFKQLQGKGYEWDWMQKQRGSINKVFKRYNAGDVCNQPGFDVEELDVITGNVNQYQMKAYTSKKNPDLHNTDPSIKVITNAEKVDVVENNGYSVEKFENREEILQNTNKRMEQIENGSANPIYSVKNVGGTMAKAGAIGCVVGMGIESVSSYKLWKKGNLSDEEYLTEILKAGGDAGITAGLSAGVMIPVNAAITAAGASTVIGIPIAFVINATLNKVVAPCFGRGKYAQYLGKLKYYQALEDVYDDFVNAVEKATANYVGYINSMQKQQTQYSKMKQKSMEINTKLKNIYDSI